MARRRQTRRRWRRPEIEETRRSPTRLSELIVELIHQKALQRKLCANSDGRAHQCQQRYLSGK
jgi:hypothetical protein